MPTVEWKQENDEGVEITHALPAKWEVCPDCDGEGKTYLGWAAKDQPAITQEEIDEEGPDFLEDLMGGRYDAQCLKCKGRTTVLVVDEEQLEKSNAELHVAWVEDQKEEADYQRMCDMERRMGA